MVAVLSGCGGPRLTIINESSTWLRIEAASEIDYRRSSLLGPLAGDGALSFGVPPGAKLEQELEPGGSMFTQRRLGVVMRIEAGTKPGSGLLRSPTITNVFRVRLDPPGPYVLRISGKLNEVEFVRTDSQGRPMEDDDLYVVPLSGSVRWDLPLNP